MSPLYLSYAIVEIHLILFTAAILGRLDFNLGSEREVKELRRIIYAYFAVLATDIFWVLVEGGAIHPAALLNAAVNGISLAAVTAGCYFWYRFVSYRLKIIEDRDIKKNIWMRIPVLFVIAADLISIFTGWVFYIDANGHYRLGEWFVIQAVGTYLYLVVSTVRSLYCAAKTHSSLKWKECWIYAFYMVPPLIAGLIKDLVPGAPILYLGMFMCIHILFLTIRDGQIYYDALTGMNNRKRLDKYLDERLPFASQSNPLFIFMMDVDKFKTINDSYGHVEGDEALRLVSAALKKTASKYGSFVARYGGDEFCMVMEGKRCDAGEVVSSLQESLHREEEKETGRPYRISVGIGWTECRDPNESIAEIIHRADKQLYENKRKKEEASLSAPR